uniref:Uncharacterized protein n=1 Tax=Arundo donax TaxID=35708 RepID=A0A0A9DFI1_ARUDO
MFYFISDLLHTGKKTGKITLEASHTLKVPRAHILGQFIENRSSMPLKVSHTRVQSQAHSLEGDLQYP